MGAWGFGLLQSDHDYNCADSLSDEVGMNLLHPEDAEATRKKLNDGTLSRLFDKYENRTRYPKSTTVILGVLAMQVGAKIEDKHLELLRKIYRSAGLYEEGERQMRKALEEYKNDGAPYFIGSLGLHDTAAIRNSLPRMCTNCKCPEPEKPLKRCAKCRSALYCSRECQKADWKTHKRFCRPGRFDEQGKPQTSASGIRSLNVDPFNAMRTYN